MVSLPLWLSKLIEDNSTSSKSFPRIGDAVKKGQRNDVLWHHATTMLSKGVPDSAIISILQTWILDPVFDNGDDPVTDEELASILESAKTRVDKAQTRSADVMQFTDAANAKRLYDAHGHELMYIEGKGWYVWTGKYWRHDLHEHDVLARMVDTMQELYVDATLVTDKRLAAKMQRFAATSSNLGKMRAAIEIARGYNPLKVDELDQNHMLLNVENGIIDMRTGMLMPHDKKLRITKIIAVPYSPAAECPTWLDTLSLAFDGNQSIISYMQRAFGYTITGSTDEQCLFIMYGPDGSNGKSTISNVLEALLGEYAEVAQPEVLQASNSSNSKDAQVASMLGARMVSMNEATGHRLREDVVKQWTGGDTIVARHLYQAPFSFIPSHKIWMRTNDKPTIIGTDDAIWRRIKLIPFEKSIPVEKRRPMSEVLEALEQESQGVLLWLVNGAKEWYDNRRVKGMMSGLDEPKIIQDAQNTYRAEMNEFRAFLDDVTDFTGDDADSITKVNLFWAFNTWQRDTGRRLHVSRTRFNKEMTRLGMQEKRLANGGARIWFGVLFNTVWTGEAERAGKFG
jgi:putative DNA primase/helicase